MKKTLAGLFVALSLLVSTVPSFAQGTLPPHVLPDPKETPGSTRTTDKTDVYICGRTKGGKHSTKEIRKLLKQSMINDTYTRYHLKTHSDGQCNGVKQHCEVDHLISLELGGKPDDPANLWPQPFEGLWNAHDKDKLENELHKRVCGGQMNLVDAQNAIKSDWIKAYQDTFHTQSPLPIGKHDVEDIE